MRHISRRILLGIPLALALLALAAYAIVDAWLESAGGRRAVERTLADRIGLPVRLAGDFRVMLLPTIGVTGTDLVIGDPEPDGEILRGGEYALSLSIQALFKGRVLIESIRLVESAFYLGRGGQPRDAAAGGAARGLVLPEIRLLELEGFRVIDSAGEGQSWRLQELRIEGFADGRPTPFSLDMDELGAWVGNFSWSGRTAEFALETAGRGPWPGEIRVQATAMLDAARGAVEAIWPGDAGSPTGLRPEVRLSFAYTALPKGVRLDSFQLDAEPLAVRGDGCLLIGEPPSLHLDLAADRVDLDALPSLDSFTSGARADDAGPEFAMDVRLRLSAAEFTKSGAVARQGVLQLGSGPDCRELQAAPAD
jgi:hypothetical protein